MSPNPTLASAAFRLSAQQERAWSEQERGIAQFAQCVVRIEGQLDVARLKQAISSVVGKYEILRTVLRRQAGVKLPFQVILEEPNFSFVQVPTGDVEALLRSERESLAGLEEGPTLRALLIADMALLSNGGKLAIVVQAFLTADVAFFEWMGWRRGR